MKLMRLSPEVRMSRSGGPTLSSTGASARCDSTTLSSTLSGSSLPAAASLAMALAAEAMSPLPLKLRATLSCMPVLEAVSRSILQGTPGVNEVGTKERR